MGLIFFFFFENVEILNSISKMQKKIEKMFFISEIVASELAFLDCLY